MIIMNQSDTCHQIMSSSLQTFYLIISGEHEFRILCYVLDIFEAVTKK